MGLQVSYLKTLIVNQSSTDQCLPVTPYVKFPRECWAFQEDRLLMDIHVYPEKLQRCTDDGSWYWWCDAEFHPFNDLRIFATGSAFRPRATRHWIPVPSMPNGRVLLYQLPSSGNISCQIFSRSNSSVYPKVQPHPIGDLVCYCGTGEVVVMGSGGDPLFQRARDLSNAVHVFCAIAKNGISFACLKRGMGAFFLETYILQSSMTANDFVRCQTICPGFIPSQTVADSVQCKFSPNSKLIVVSSSKGFLFAVTRSKLEKYCIICPDMIEQNLSASAAFDFDPRYPFEVLTIGTMDKFIHILNLETKEVLGSTQLENLVDCIRYTPDGKMLAVAYNNFDIHIFSGDSLSCIQTIAMSDVCESDIPRIHRNFQAVLNLSFSQNGQQLVSSSCDGHIRLWHIPRLLTLQEICRDTILSCLSIRHAKKLDIPSKLKDFLVYRFF